MQSDLWLANPENSNFLSGATSKPKGNSSAAVGGCLFTFIMVLTILVFGGFGLRELLVRNQLEREGERIGATITNLVIDDSDDSTSYEVTYSYRVGTHNYSRMESVSQGFYNQLRVGQRLDILYHSSNPDESRIAVDTGNPTWVIFLVIGAVAVLLEIGTALAVLGQANRRNRLLRDGKIVYGELTLVDGHIDSDNDLMIRLGYRIPRPDGTFFEHQPRFRTGHNEWKDRVPKVGDRVAVLYLDDKTHQLL
jgi:hypothetical protein